MNKKQKYIIVFVVLFLLMPTFAHAGPIEDSIAWILGWIAATFTKVMGYATGAAVALIINLAQYNDFVNNNQVRDAWIIIRDICNMMFVLILLVISFASILRIETYNIKKSLPKLVLMAILINFSRMIVGLMIDFSQVFMLTFVSSFASVEGNFHNALGIDKMLEVVRDAKAEEASNLTAKTVSALYILSVIFMIIALIVLVSILIIFLMRIVMLWILTALSPLAFLLSAFPAGQKYASQYWGMLSKYLINGPVLAFFIWMALNVSNNLTTTFAKVDSGAELEILQSDVLASFAMTVGMLVGGMMISQQIGGMGSGVGMNLLNRTRGAAQGFATRQAARVGRGVRDTAWGATTSVGRMGLAGLRAGDSWIGKRIQREGGTLARQGVVGGTLATIGSVPRRFLNSLGNSYNAIVNNNPQLDRQRHENRIRRQELQRERGTLDVADPQQLARQQEIDRQLGDMHIDHQGVRYHEDADGNYVNRNNGDAPLVVGGRNVSRMEDFEAARYEAWNRTQSGARAARQAAEREASNRENVAGLSNAQMREELNDPTISNARRRRLSLELAGGRGFNTNAQVETAREAVANNPEMLREFNENIYRNQAHLAHDLTTEGGRRQLNTAMERGQVDPSRLSADAMRDENVHRTLMNRFGRRYNEVVQSIYRNGTNEVREAAHQGMLNVARSLDPDVDDATRQRAQISHANITGRVNESFRDRTGNVRHDSIRNFQEYFSQANATAYGNIDLASFDNFVTNAGQENFVRNNLNISNIRTANRSGENREVVQGLTRRARERVRDEMGQTDQAAVRFRQALDAANDLAEYT